MDNKTWLFLCLACIPLLPAAAKDAVILVYPFENSSDGRYAWLTAGMTDTVISDLRKVKGIQVIAEGDRRKAMEELALHDSGLVSDAAGSAKVGKLLGADYVFTGSFSVAEKGVRVNARIVSVQAGRVEKSVKVDGTLDRIFDLQDSVVVSLMSEASQVKNGRDAPRISFTEADRKQVESSDRPDPRAYEAYSKAILLEDTDHVQAFASFVKALQYQPDYIDALLGAAQMAAESNRKVEALSFLERAEKANRLRTPIDELQEGLIYSGYAYVYERNGDRPNAISYLAKCMSVLDRKGLENTIQYASLLVSAGNVFLNTDPQRAREYYIRAKEIGDKLERQSSAPYAGLLMNIASTHAAVGEHDAALALMNRARQILNAQGLNETARYADLLGNSALVYDLKGDRTTAARLLDEELRLLEKLKLDQTARYADALLNIANVHSGAGNHQTALDLAARADKLYVRLGLHGTSNYAVLMINMGTDFLEKNDSRTAEQHFQKADEILTRLEAKNSYTYADLLTAYGTLWSSRGETGRARDYFTNAGRLYHTLGLEGTDSYADFLLSFAALQHKAGERRGASNDAAKAAVIFEKLGRSSQAERARALSKAYAGSPN